MLSPSNHEGFSHPNNTARLNIDSISSALFLWDNDFFHLNSFRLRMNPRRKKFGLSIKLSKRLKIKLEQFGVLVWAYRALNDVSLPPDSRMLIFCMIIFDGRSHISFYLSVIFFHYRSRICLRGRMEGRIDELPRWKIPHNKRHSRWHVQMHGKSNFLFLSSDTISGDTFPFPSL